MLSFTHAKQKLAQEARFLLGFIMSRLEKKKIKAAIVLSIIALLAMVLYNA
jgi:hypothetical protein